MERLKCNRSHPCENCVKRGDASSCAYAQPSARKKNAQQQSASASPDDMQNRIDRLEGLVLSLMTNGYPSTGSAAAMAALSGNDSAGSTHHSNSISVDEDEGPTGPEESDTEQVTKSFGIMKVDNNKSYYISDAHWASVLSDVSPAYTITSPNYSDRHNRLQKCGIISTPTSSSTKNKQKSFKQHGSPPMSPDPRCFLAPRNRQVELRSCPRFLPDTQRIS